MKIRAQIPTIHGSTTRSKTNQQISSVDSKRCSVESSKVWENQLKTIDFEGIATFCGSVLGFNTYHKKHTKPTLHRSKMMSKMEPERHRKTHPEMMRKSPNMRSRNARKDNKKVKNKNIPENVAMGELAAARGVHPANRRGDSPKGSVYATPIPLRLATSNQPGTRRSPL